ncbi:MAG TPA: hypothetical protein GXX20_12695 [Clostridiaceae bacterium]|nr:hypothetical protein [Clostridiaceae bacterium]
MRLRKVMLKKMTTKITSIVLVILFLLSVSPVVSYAGLDNPTEPDVIIAKAEGSYKLHFPDIVNVPAEVYNGAHPNGKLLVAYYKNTVHAPGDASQPFGGNIHC